MRFNYSLVQRLGFDAYVSNVVVNLIEDGLLHDGYRFENETYSLGVDLIKDKYLVTVRAYVASMGWQTAEIAV